MKETLILKIKQAFKDVKLENGVGLWEGQGLDDYASDEERKKLRAKDEKEDWSSIPPADLCRCDSSLSFFDGKGMRFHLPAFLLLDLEESETHVLNTDLTFTLTSVLKYLDDDSKNGKRMKAYGEERFSFLNFEQIDCAIDFLKYRKEKIEAYYNEEFGGYGLEHDPSYIELQKGIDYWTEKKTK